MSGLRLTVVDGGPCRLEKSKIVAFAPETVSIPTTIGIIEHPKHGLVLWDTGVNHVVADPEEGEKYWGPGIRDALARKGSLASTQLTSNSKSLVSRPMTSATSSIRTFTSILANGLNVGAIRKAPSPTAQEPM